MTHKKPLRRAVVAVLQNNNFAYSVCIQNIDTNVMSYAVMKKGDVSWGKKEMRLFVSKQVTFIIPYAEVDGFTEFPDLKQIEIRLSGRILVSIRETK